MLCGKATLPIWFELSHDYVGQAVTEPIYEPVGLIHAGFLTIGLFLGRKSKMSQVQNVKEFQFYIHMPNFRLLGSIIKKRYPKVADPLKGNALFTSLRGPSKLLRPKMANILIFFLLEVLRQCFNWFGNIRGVQWIKTPLKGLQRVGGVGVKKHIFAISKK